MNITLDDLSPQIRYFSSGSIWKGDTSSALDPFTDQYYDRTMHSTWGQDDTATISFYGRGITIYGAQRRNHGVYTVSVNGGEAESYNSHFDGERIQTQLYTTSSLGDGLHTLVLTNQPALTIPPPANNTRSGSYWVDIDYMVICSQVEEFRTTTYDDTDSAFTYSDGWEGKEGISDDQNRFNFTVHVSSDQTQYVDFSFDGASVQLFGSLDRTVGDYSVQLDNGEAINLNGTYHRYLSPVSLYAAAGLSDSTHNLRLTNLSPGTGFNVDYAVVNSTKIPSLTSISAKTALTTSSLTTQNPSSTILSQPVTRTTYLPIISPNPDSKSNEVAQGEGEQAKASNTRAVAGGVTAAVMILVLLIVGIWYRRSRNRTSGTTRITSGEGSFVEFWDTPRPVSNPGAGGYIPRRPFGANGPRTTITTDSGVSRVWGKTTVGARW